MLNTEKMEILEIAIKENAVTIDMALSIYNHRSSASRSMSQMVNDQLLEQRNAPTVSKYDKIWIPTEKSRKLLE